jgi:hypothetical protein
LVRRGIALQVTEIPEQFGHRKSVELQRADGQLPTDSVEKLADPDFVSVFEGFSATVIDGRSPAV